MTEVISGLFNDPAMARQAVRALEQAGFGSADVSLVGSGSEHHDREDSATDGAATGATVGGLAGAGAGLLTALGVIAIPGLGPLVAAGALATTLATAAGGALAGGVVGGLIDYGVTSEDAEVYAEGVRRGGTLVTVRAAEDQAAQARRILAEHGAVDSASMRGSYESEGWTGYDAKAPAYTREEMERERERYRT